MKETYVFYKGTESMHRRDGILNWALEDDFNNERND